MFSEIINWWMCPYECPNIWDRLRVLWFSGTVNCTRIIHARTMQARWQPKLIADKNFANKLNEISSAYFRPSFASPSSSSFFWFWSFLFFYSNSFYLYNYKSATILCSNKKKERRTNVQKRPNEQMKRQARHCVESWIKLQSNSSFENQHFTIPKRLASASDMAKLRRKGSHQRYIVHGISVLQFGWCSKMSSIVRAAFHTVLVVSFRWP